ncbi:PRKC apoptosis WT1 regulator protein-like isoform X2 [Lineus longissimus]|uniref:PRKC apoptosis WT1 regulator protein-like isoform X2 n=1 Tax=Lineus longissimus TaxID=88925 RepID=UPI00315CECF7
MASSSVSQESLDREEYEPNTRRSRFRILRGRSSTHRSGGESLEMPDKDQNGEGAELEPLAGDRSPHESPTRTSSRFKDKTRGRPNHLHSKGKTAKDKRKLREKRRSTGVVHLPSTESTGDSLDDDSGETKKNTSYNESVDPDTQQSPEEHMSKPYVCRRNKSPSDLEADLEDNQDYDSTVSQSETNLSIIGQTAPPDYSTTKSNNRVRSPDSSKGGQYGNVSTDSSQAKNVHFCQRLPSGGNYSGVTSSSYKDGDSGDSKLSSNSSEEKNTVPVSKTDELEQRLMHEQEENTHLRQLLEDKDRRIAELEKQVASITKEVDDLDMECETLHRDNQTLFQVINNLGGSR